MSENESMLFGKFPNFTAFLLSVQFKIFKKMVRYLCSVSRCLLNHHKAISKEFFFKLYYRGAQTLKSEFFAPYFYKNILKNRINIMAIDVLKSC